MNYPKIGSKVRFGGQTYTVQEISERGDVRIKRTRKETWVPVEALTLLDEEGR